MAEHLTKGLDQIQQIIKTHVPDESKAILIFLEVTPVIHDILKLELDDMAKRVDQIIQEVFER